MWAAFAIRSVRRRTVSKHQCGGVADQPSPSRMVNNRDDTSTPKNDMIIDGVGSAAFVWAAHWFRCLRVGRHDLRPYPSDGYAIALFAEGCRSDRLPPGRANPHEGGADPAVPRSGTCTVLGISCRRGRRPSSGEVVDDYRPVCASALYSRIWRLPIRAMLCRGARSFGRRSCSSERCCPASSPSNWIASSSSRGIGYSRRQQRSPVRTDRPDRPCLGNRSAKEIR